MSAPVASLLSCALFMFIEKERHRLTTSDSAVAATDPYLEHQQDLSRQTEAQAGPNPTYGLLLSMHVPPPKDPVFSPSLARYRSSTLASRAYPSPCLASSPYISSTSTQRPAASLGATYPRYQTDIQNQVQFLATIKVANAPLRA